MKLFQENLLTFIIVKQGVKIRATTAGLKALNALDT